MLLLAFHSIFGDAHLYSDHIENIKMQIKRPAGELPNIVIAKKPFFEITFNDISLHNYTPAAFIKYPVAV